MGKFKGMSRFTDTDHGYDDLLEQLEELEEGETFYIGLFSSDLEQVIKGAIHEFGAPGKNIPARHWLSTFYDQYNRELDTVFREAAIDWLSHGGDKEEVYGNASEEVLVLLEEFLSQNNLVPDLKPETWARKDGDMMNETGAMISAIAVRYNAAKSKFRGQSVKGKVRKVIEDFRIRFRK